MEISRIETAHPLTEQYINLVVEGKTPFEATMRLVGPDLPRALAPRQLSDWEADLDVRHQISVRKAQKIELGINLRRQIIERVQAMAFSDVRKYFDSKGPIPVANWSKDMGQAVRKIKFREREDPFGNVTRSFDIEFYDVLKCIGALVTLFPEQLADIKDINRRQKLEEVSEETLREIHKALLTG